MMVLHSLVGNDIWTIIIVMFLGLSFMDSDKTYMKSIGWILWIMGAISLLSFIHW